MHWKVIYADPFKTQIGVYRSVGLLKNWMKSEGITDEVDGDHVEAMACRFYTPQAMWFAMVIPKSAKAPLIAHECSHMADFIFDHKGVPISMDNTEVRAYLIEHLMHQIMYA